MKITRADFADLETIWELQKLAYQSEALINDDWNIPPLTQSFEELCAEYDRRVFLKAVVSDHLVGSVRAHENNYSCHIGRLIVHPEWQGRGIGTALMNEIEKQFSTVGYYELFTGHKSERNIRLYEKLGYTIYQNQDNLVFMKKKNCI